MSEKLDYEISSGNVFADLGLPNPEEALAKAQIAHQIHTIIEEKGLTQAQAGKILGVPQSKVSNVVLGNLSGFSMERLLRFLNALDHEVEIIVRPKESSGESAGINVVAID